MSPVDIQEVENETESENPLYVKDGKSYRDDTLTFKIPATSPVEESRGKKQEVGFTFQVCVTEAEANAVLEAKEWKFLDLVNDKLRAGARSNAYQAALAPHKPSTMSEDDITERMIRDYIRLGVSEEIARAQVTALRNQVGR